MQLSCGQHFPAGIILFGVGKTSLPADAGGFCDINAYLFDSVFFMDA